MKTYIASPFFNEVQISQVEAIENLLKNLDDEFYSPRLHGNFSELKLDEKMSKLAKSLIFKDNIYQIKRCERVIVNLNGHRDIGTLFELGAAIGLGKDVEIIIDDSDHDCISFNFPSLSNTTDVIKSIEFKMDSNVSILNTAYNLNNYFDVIDNQCHVIVDTNNSNSYPAGIILLGYFYAKGIPVSYISNFVSKSNLMISESGIKQYKSIEDYFNKEFVDYSKMEIQ